MGGKAIHMAWLVEHKHTGARSLCRIMIWTPCVVPKGRVLLFLVLLISDGRGPSTYTLSPKTCVPSLNTFGRMEPGFRLQLSVWCCTEVRGIAISPALGWVQVDPYVSGRFLHSNKAGGPNFSSLNGSPPALEAPMILRYGFLWFLWGENCSKRLISVYYMCEGDMFFVARGHFLRS